MLKLLLTTLLAISLLPPSLGSIQVLRLATGNCTAFSINEQRSLWLTAGHCLPDDASVEMTIADTVATVVWKSDKEDLAVLKGPSAPALRLAPSDVLMGTEIELRATHWGYPVVIRTWGRVGALNVEWSDIPRPVSIVGLSGSPGSSGAPLLSHGRVVGLYQGYIGRSTSASALTFYVPHRALLETLSFWQHPLRK